MKSYLSIILVAFSCMVLSCKESDELPGDNITSVPISFNIDSNDSLTRASKLTSMPDFTLYAYDSNGTAIINGGKFNANGTSKVGDIYYWPASGYVTFYAFAPYANSYVTWNANNKRLTYNADANINNQQDVIYAYNVSARTKDGKVTLNFKHANAGLAVKYSTSSDLPSTVSVSVSNISIGNVLKIGTLAFLQGMTASGTKTTYSLGTNGLMMVAPQTITAWKPTSEKISSTTGSYLAVECKVNTKKGYIVGSSANNGTLYFPISSQSIHAGTMTTLALTIGAKQANNTYAIGYDNSGNLIVYKDDETINIGNGEIEPGESQAKPKTF